MNSPSKRFSCRIVLALALAVTACAGPSGSPTTEPSAERAAETASRRIEAERTRMEPTPGDGLAALEEVRIPRAEAWLEQPLPVRYRDLPADQAIRQVLQGRPVRFDLPGPGESAELPGRSMPRVRSSPTAKTVRDHLTSIAVQADWSWTLQAGVVLVREFETRRFTLSSPPGHYVAGLGLRNLNESGGSVADNRLDLALDPYANEILAQVRNVLGLGHESDGGGAVDPRVAVTVAPSANLITVTAKPNALREVAALLDDFDRAVRRIVRIHLSLIEVDFRDGAQRDLALNLIRRSRRLPLNLLLGSSTATVLSGTGAVSVLGGDVVSEGGAALGAVMSRPSQRETGSSAVAQWLDTFGEATIAFDDTVEIVNNRIASVDLTRTEQYISSITREVVEGSDQLSTEVEFEDLRTGLVVHLQPTVRDDGRITLTLGFSRSALVGRTPYDFGTVQGVTHVTDDFNRLLSVSLQAGEPRLLASLSEAASREDRSRIPFFGRFGLNAGKERSVRQREMVMMITADVVDG